MAVRPGAPPQFCCPEAVSSSEKGNYWDRALDVLRTLEASFVHE